MRAMICQSLKALATGKFVKTHTIFEQCKYSLQYYVSDFTLSFDMADFFSMAIRL